MFARSTRWVLILLSAGLSTALAFGATDIYVDPTAPGSQNGSSWYNAFHTIEAAITAANGTSGEVDILVSDGEFSPTTFDWNGSSDETKTFLLKSSSSDHEVRLLGGFLGCIPGDGLPCASTGSTTADSPDGSYEDSILSGETYDNYHVLVADNAQLDDARTVVDGFKVIGGLADGNAPNDDGAGIHCGASAKVRVENIMFTNSIADEDGGGVYHTGGSGGYLEVKQSTFDANSATRGGGLFASTSASVKLVNAEFYDNGLVNGSIDAEKGGAIYTEDEVILDCSNGLFYGNSAADKGGAVYVEPNPCTTGGPYLQHWRQCTFAYNEIDGTSTDGAGFHVQARSSPASCPDNADMTVHIFNSIFWGQSGGDDLHIEANSKVDVNYTCWDEQTNGAGTYTVDLPSFNDDPEFIDAASHNYRLNAEVDSPCINYGDNGEIGDDFLDLDNNPSTTLLPLDLDLTTRIQDTTVDLGSYED